MGMCKTASARKGVQFAAMIAFILLIGAYLRGYDLLGRQIDDGPYSIPVVAREFENDALRLAYWPLGWIESVGRGSVWHVTKDSRGHTTFE